MIGEDKDIRLGGGCKLGEACSIVLRGASSHVLVLDDAERSFHDALCILQAIVKEPRTICGGGCTEILMAQVSSITSIDPNERLFFSYFIGSTSSHYSLSSSSFFYFYYFS